MDEEFGHDLDLVAAEEGTKGQARLMALFFNEFIENTACKSSPENLPALIAVAGSLSETWLRAGLEER